MSRLAVAASAVALLAAVGVAGGSGPPPFAVGAASRSLRPDETGPGGVVVTYQPPLPPPLRVVHAFSAPGPYAAGERGVDLAATGGEVVTAAALGQVRFAGPVAGRGVVVLAHPDGISTEYEPVRPLVRAGTSVVAGQPIGEISGTHPGCAPNRCLHWGAHRAGVYLDPMSLLRPLGPVRLLPWPG